MVGGGAFEHGCSEDWHGCRWGDYSATAADPLDNDVLWTFQEYAAKPLGGESRYGIGVAAVRAPCGGIDCGPCQVCLSGTCQPAPDGHWCSDGTLCTTHDRCLFGKCVGSAKICPGAGPCRSAGACDPQTGACASLPAHEGAACDDGSGCTDDDRCFAGTCTGKPKVCAGKDLCHAAYCDWQKGQCVVERVYNPPACQLRTRGNGLQFGCNSGRSSGPWPWLLALTWVFLRRCRR